MHVRNFLVVEDEYIGFSLVQLVNKGCWGNNRFYCQVKTRLLRDMSINGVAKNNFKNNLLI